MIKFFFQELVNKFKFHHFDNLRGSISTKIDPRMAKNESRAQILFDLLFSVAAGDLSALRRYFYLYYGKERTFNLELLKTMHYINSIKMLFYFCDWYSA